MTEFTFHVYRSPGTNKWYAEQQDANGNVFGVIGAGDSVLEALSNLMEEIDK